MIWVIFLYIDTVFGFYGYFFMLSWMFQHDYFDTCCFVSYMRVFSVFVFAPVQCN